MKQKPKEKEIKYLTYPELYKKHQESPLRKSLSMFFSKVGNTKFFTLSTELTSTGGYVNKAPLFNVIINEGNCKNVFFCNIRNCLYTGKYTKKSEQFLDMAENILAYLGYVTFSVNVTEPEYLEVIQTRFKLIDYMVLPIGYGQGFQYHAVFLSYSKVSYDQRIEEAHEKKMCRGVVQTGQSLLNIKGISKQEVKKLSFFKMLTGKILNKLKIK